MKQANYATYKTLKAAGISEVKAAAITKAIIAFSTDVANQCSNKQEIIDINKKLAKLIDELEKIELRMIIKFGSLISISTSLLLAAIKLWI